MNKRVILEAGGIVKVFPGVRALNKVDFTLYEGEIRALVGENGAGKTTLVKILSGVYQPDQGEILLRGNKATIPDPYQAQHMGISIVYQELNLIPYMSVARNILLGREPRTSLGFVNSPKLVGEADKLMAMLDLSLDADSLIYELPVAQQQMVAIVRALSANPDILILDEPTASLSEHEVKHLFEVMRNLKNKGVSIIFISHRLEEVFQIADSATVLKDGELVATRGVQEINQGELIRMMVGREFVNIFPQKGGLDIKEDIVFSLRGLTRRGALKDINLDLRRGEVVIVAGLRGQGQRELVRAIFGVDPIDKGEIHLEGRKIQINSPRDAIRAGIGFLSDDRKTEGLVLCRSIRENVALPTLGERKVWGFINRKEEKEAVASQVKALDIRTTSIEQEAQFLSGGNQQKLIIAKWLLGNPRVIIFDEPTVGIDVGTKIEIYHRLRRLAQEGTGILIVSSDMIEIIGMSDRVLVMFEGEIVAEIPAEKMSEEKIMAAAAGEKTS
ncbi:sugar ABC transporter ATP-binding protein [Candidatus Aerophobetes bacterium]|uniref:Sugar ABC transporter ATP-binding protein n=1 Tax=Aerophobetes bacterium TaxID=2030807 RepID=A0A523QJD7_UNCAE|nr:MAG: sugar ABC transporter ATP-binding protein [Candidatus Aerophobetes bacterium]